MARKPGSTKALLEERLDRVEELLATGVPSGKIATTLARDYGVTRRQIYNLIAKVDARWERETQEDAPFRRERLQRKVNRFYARCIAEKKYGPASQALVLEAKLVGAFTQRNPELDARIAALGPPPKDPTRMLLYAQQLMALAFHDAMTSPVLDERRLRWIVEFVKAFGLTHARALFESKMQVIEERLGITAGEEDADEESPAASGDSSLRA